MTKKPILYISCGVPGSGKSTFLNSHKKENEVIVSRDNIRFSLLLDGEDYFAHEDEVFSTFVKEITNALARYQNVYADATHLNERSRNKLYYAVKNNTNVDFNTEAIYFNIPLPICLERNNYRKDTKAYVPEHVIKKMYSNISEPFEDYFNHCWIINKDNICSKLY